MGEGGQKVQTSSFNTILYYVLSLCCTPKTNSIVCQIYFNFKKRLEKFVVMEHWVVIRPTQSTKDPCAWSRSIYQIIKVKLKRTKLFPSNITASQNKAQEDA